MDFANAFDQLSRQEFAMNVAAAAAGFFAPNILRTGVENYAGMDWPDEAYGAATGAAFWLADERVMAAGSAVNVADRVLNRYGIAFLGGDF
ncbi:hypothetical protein [Halostella sp. PRR32]|uniref:hypothetical protein n=1 Tax=Halostella sp. PRR32 TaxID=3098147 RepID=UPI002B1DDC31|nr:hypothetical protein [Halostella sp. PRR32]